jgi:hypothetical protein
MVISSNLELFLDFELLHWIVMRGLMVLVLVLSHLILKENLTIKADDAFSILIKGKNE